MTRRVDIVPHTHWDREWHEPFQSFRLRLVRTLDRFLPTLDADPALSHFQLDGQLAVVDDYLEVRPEAEPLLTRLVEDGRLAIGPWYTLPDEFLVSGETLVRNLQRGLARAAELGGAMAIGYLPDSFGHVAQMPQLLRLVGAEHAVLWRGVPSAIASSAFWWESPDGSRVRAEYLVRGYGAGVNLPPDGGGVVDRIRGLERDLGAMLEGPILLMNGGDHEAPHPWLATAVAAANEAQDDYDIVITSLDAHVRDGPTPTQTWRGELRSGARASLLAGVTSNRADVRRAAAAAERALERRAEPLSALLLPAKEFPGRLLDLAWGRLLHNAAHDSVCACSADDVVDAVLVRYAEARHIAHGLAAAALDAFAESLADGGMYVLNPSAHRRSGIVEVTLDGQEIRPGEPVPMPPEYLALIVHRLQDPTVPGHRPIAHAACTDVGDDLLVRIQTGRSQSREAAEVLRRASATISDRRHQRYLLALDRPRRERVLAQIAVDGLGWQPVAVRDPSHPVETEGHRITNGLITLAVDIKDGTFSINGHDGFGRLVVGGDVGDTYTYCPPADDVLLDAPTDVQVELVESGPLRSSVVIRASYAGTVFATTLELRAGEPLIRVSTRWINDRRDQRVRMHMPIPGPPVMGSFADCAFATVERGLIAEGSERERGMPTYPARQFVRAGALTVAFDCVREYEVLESGTALALTLLRSVGMLSRGPMPTRWEPAGPQVPVAGAQQLGPAEAVLAIAVDPDVDPYRVVEDLLDPLLVVNAPGGAWREASGRLLAVEGAEVSAVRRTVHGQLEVRVWNPRPEPTTFVIADATGAIVDLLGHHLAAFDGHLELGPAQIATVVLDDPLTPL